MLQKYYPQVNIRGSIQSAFTCYQASMNLQNEITEIMRLLSLTSNCVSETGFGDENLTRMDSRNPRIGHCSTIT